jgi:GTP-binding protein YchF
MKTAIVGFAGSGKTTVFNALTGMSADTGFGGKDKANLGLIQVPDPRVAFLAKVYAPKKTTLAEVAFVDVAGPEANDAGRGLDARVMEHAQKAEALVHVVRAFDNPALAGGVDPLADLQAFDGELILADLIKVEKRLERLAKEGGKASAEIALMQKLRAQLDAGAALRVMEFTAAESQIMSGYQFVSLKPCLALVNRPEHEASEPPPGAVAAAAQAAGMGVMSMAAGAEAKIALLAEHEQAEFLSDLGLQAPARDRFINAVYSMLDLISFLTSGADECRAWTIRRGTVARSAAGKIHSDIERGFIRAEVTAFADFEALGSESKCRDAGKMRLEGKDYEVQDGDIINFRFNV